MEPKKVIGTVKWFDCSKGFGFICSTKETNNEEVFLHHSQAEKDGKEKEVDGRKYVNFSPGEKLSFTPILDKKGWRASNVQRV